ncbi:hypothetical protein [Candidatus Palauibacter sp.]|uniref:hypothetical protein n=1 Tax=Candidatus Palauibacter sp. TaxID=3101350 RepID=UPI003B52D1E3
MSRNRHYLGRPLRRTALAGALLASLTAIGCMGDEEAHDEAREAGEEVSEVLDGAADEIAAVVTNAMDEVGRIVAEAAEGLSAGALVEDPIPFRELEEFLPDRVGDFRVMSREGGTGGAMGFKLSAVEAEYEGGNRAEVDISIVDTGALPVIGSEGFVEWLDLEVDEENDRGWARTIEYGGHPAMEEFRRTDGDRGRVTFTYFVEGRFVVVIEGRRVSVDEVYEIRDRIDTDGLARLRDRDGG